MTSTATATIRAMLSGATGYEQGLDQLTVLPPETVDPALSTALRESGERLFKAGWQPVELHRLVTRRVGPEAARLVADVAAAMLDRTQTADPRWAAQAAEIGAERWWFSDAEYPSELARRVRADRVTVLDLIVSALALLRTLPSIEILIPPPGAAPSKTMNVEKSDNRVLDRVRALLAKAESTDFPAEAETYTAKAQEMITRHSLDEALLTADRAEVVPLTRRIPVDAPYESEKAALLHAVARANRCHAVWTPDLGFATVFGFDADIDAVDLLHASLLVQAQRAMSRTEPRGKAGKARMKAFRASFLVAFAHRIGERLAQAAKAALPAEDGNLLPVLRSRDVQVQETMNRVFPRTERARGARVDSDEGWREGRAAADQATF
ncbi:DUF2786 domain-containing protein [Catenuloplanes sp. NPDC051500]|uniref:DUF2786 domain-containing protein n=1 Tax=Catenuloplanes sp. NPDC051500 TaxID=3363959 RepID=UPI0037AD05EC